MACQVDFGKSGLISSAGQGVQANTVVTKTRLAFANPSRPGLGQFGRTAKPDIL